MNNVPKIVVPCFAAVGCAVCATDGSRNLLPSSACLHIHAWFVCAVLGRVTLPGALAYACALGVSFGWWFAHRTTAAAWVPLDVMSLSVCLVIVAQVRLGSLRVAAVLLAGAVVLVYLALGTYPG